MKPFRIPIIPIYWSFNCAVLRDVIDYIVFPYLSFMSSSLLFCARSSGSTWCEQTSSRRVSSSNIEMLLFWSGDAWSVSLSTAGQTSVCELCGRMISLSIENGLLQFWILTFHWAYGQPNWKHIPFQSILFCPVFSINWPIHHPRKLICVWNPPSRKTIEFILMSWQSLETIRNAFQYRGWSKVTTGDTLSFDACSETNLSVE